MVIALVADAVAVDVDADDDDEVGILLHRHGRPVRQDRRRQNEANQINPNDPSFSVDRIVATNQSKKGRTGTAPQKNIVAIKKTW